MSLVTFLAFACVDYELSGANEVGPGTDDGSYGGGASQGFDGSICECWSDASPTAGLNNAVASAPHACESYPCLFFEPFRGQFASFEVRLRAGGG